MTTTTLLNHDEPRSEAGVYVFRSAANPSIALYVNSASNLKRHLNPNTHHLVEYCRNQCIDATLEYEIVPDKKERERREHQLISELNPVFNIQSTTPDSGSGTESEWRSDIHLLILQLMDEEVIMHPDLNPCYERGTPEYHDEINNQIDTAVEWLEFGWDNLSNQSIRFYYDNFLPNNRVWLRRVEEDFGKVSWGEKYIDAVTANEGAKVLPETTLESPKRLWIEREPAVKGNGNLVLLYYMAEAIHGEVFDFEFPEVPSLEHRFINNILCHLHPELRFQWEQFKRKYMKLHGLTGDVDIWIPDIIESFCDHALMWNEAQHLTLFDDKAPKHLIFTKLFLGMPRLYNHLVSDFTGRYVSPTAFILAAEEFFENHRLQYRIDKDYDPNEHYLCERVDLKLI